MSKNKDERERGVEERPIFEQGYLPCRVKEWRGLGHTSVDQEVPD